MHKRAGSVLTFFAPSFAEPTDGRPTPSKKGPSRTGRSTDPDAPPSLTGCFVLPLHACPSALIGLRFERYGRKYTTLILFAALGISAAAAGATTDFLAALTATASA